MLTKYGYQSVGVPSETSRTVFVAGVRSIKTDLTKLIKSIIFIPGGRPK